ncbi:hypothetical protein [Staphylococcus phage ZCSS1]|uniref:Uncharacterized protein n=1 Tax=Staphylococcus phage UHP46 TaxID=3234966 RepID=A0AB39C8D0_9CAUD|nr:hypothetical protein [Staphylococcus phage ZCSS1]
MDTTQEYVNKLKELLTCAIDMDTYSQSFDEADTELLYTIGISELIYLDIDWCNKNFVEAIHVLKGYGIKVHTGEIVKGTPVPIDAHKYDSEYKPIMFILVDVVKLKRMDNK